jgi:hypothetical protein
MHLTCPIASLTTKQWIDTSLLGPKMGENVSEALQCNIEHVDIPVVKADISRYLVLWDRSVRWGFFRLGCPSSTLGNDIMMLSLFWWKRPVPKLWIHRCCSSTFCHVLCRTESRRQHSPWKMVPSDYTYGSGGIACWDCRLSSEYQYFAASVGAASRVYG